MNTDVPAIILLAVAVFAHAWVPRVSGKPGVVNTVGWVIVVLTFLALASQWLPGR